MRAPPTADPPPPTAPQRRLLPIAALGVALAALTPVLVQRAVRQRRGPLPLTAATPGGGPHGAGSHGTGGTGLVDLPPQFLIAAALAVPLALVLVPLGMRLGGAGRRGPDGWPAWVGTALGTGLVGAVTGAGTALATAPAALAPDGPVAEVVLVSATAVFRYGVLLGLVAAVLATVRAPRWTRQETRTR